MCLTALAQAGAPPGPGRDLAYAWLAGSERRWASRDREIDFAQALEALLYDPDEPADLHGLVERLLHRVSKALDGRDPPAVDAPAEALRIPFVTAQLASIVWTTVNREYTNLLRGLTDVDVGSKPGTDAGPPGSPATGHPLPPGRLTQEPEASVPYEEAEQ